MQIQASTPPEQIREFQRAMQAIGRSHERGVTFALNGVAKSAKQRLEKVIKGHIDQPTPFTQKALFATFVPPGQADVRTFVSAVGIKEDQSVYLKYLLGYERQTRLPGDVGPADDHIFVPIWGNLERLENIKPLYGANLPRKALQRLFKKAGMTGDAAAGAQASRAKRKRKAKGPGVFWGAPTLGGQKQGLGLWSRPERVRGINQGAPTMLVAAADKSKHDPLLQRAWDQAIIDSWSEFGGRLEAELRNATDHEMRRRQGAGTGR